MGRLSSSWGEFGTCRSPWRSTCVEAGRSKTRKTELALRRLGETAPVSAPRVIVVVKRTHYGRYVEEENDPEVRKLLKRRDPSVANWVKSHQEHVKTLAEVQRALKKLGARVWVVQGPRVVFDASDAALVVTVGGDGTLLAASHHVGKTPILGVNSSPGSSVGFFCAGRRSNAEAMLSRALAGNGRQSSLVAHARDA